MVGLCLVSYSVGCICLNFLSFYFTDADSLMICISGIITVAVLPNFFLLKESPKFLYEKGKVTELVNTLNSIAEKNQTKLAPNYFKKILKIEHVDLKSKHEAIELVRSSEIKDKTIEKLSEPALKRLFLDKKISLTLVALCVQSATIFMIYYGLTSSIQDLGMKSIQLNGILMGCTQLIGYLFMAYYGPKLQRVRAAKLCLALEIFGAFVLFCLSFCKQTDQVMLLQSLVSTLWMTTIVSAHMGILYLQNAESFPTELRGLAIAFILLFGKMSGAAAPFIEEYTKSIGMHVLVGCSFCALVAYPLVATLDETLDDDMEDGILAH